MVIPVGPGGGTQYFYQIRVERVGDTGEVVGVSDDSKGFQITKYEEFCTNNHKLRHSF